MPPLPTSTLDSSQSPQTASAVLSSYNKSPLTHSLLTCVAAENAVTDTRINQIAMENNPRYIKGVGDKAQYWVDNKGEAISFNFPALLDINGKFSRIGHYFNLPKDNVDIAALQKTKALFELRPLPNDPMYPSEAIKCSAMTLQMLLCLYTEVEAKRNKGIDTGRQPSTIPFWRVYDEEDRYAIIVNSPFLFEGIPDHKKQHVPQMNRTDIGRFDVNADILLSPSKVRRGASVASPTNNTARAVPHSVTGTRTVPISVLPDPSGRYEAWIAQYGLEDTNVVAPQVRDVNGVLIQPAEYSLKLLPNTIVSVEVVLKVWEIGSRAAASKDPALSTRTKDENGSRIYQVMLRRMQILPVNTMTSNTILDAGPSDPFISDTKAPAPKRKADANSNVAEPPSPSKKTNRNMVFDGSGSDDEMQLLK